MKIETIFLTILVIVSLAGCSFGKRLDVDKQLQYCVSQTLKSTATLKGSQLMPRSIATGTQDWRKVNYSDWTCGFWPGILWFNYEFTGDEQWKIKADSFTRSLFRLADSSAIDHDLGFQIFCSAGNGYRITEDKSYKEVLLRSADTLAKLFNPRVGTILSWPRMVNGVDWPLRHNTIMDNMMNLELLLWASKNGGGKHLYDIAVTHAETTMNNHFRPDYTSYHVVVYDTVSGKKVKGITHQGYADNSMWARGQSWAIYGFTMMFRETKMEKFLDFGQKVADVYLAKLPQDLIPYWDFDAPGIPNEPKDASAAAITASALLQLSELVADKNKATMYREKAIKMLQELSSERYQSREVNSTFLLHSTGHKPNNSEVNASIIYADYYYQEALLHLKKIRENLD